MCCVNYEILNHHHHELPLVLVELVHQVLLVIMIA